MILPLNGSADPRRILVDEYGISIGTGENELPRETRAVTWDSLTPEQQARVREIEGQVEALGAKLGLILGE